ncbi:cytochrome P450 [Nocardia spumae]|uniref:cytochrome P450 n=1 Tax=Nocardia spumae TaxID=2887190 RepID=UPI001D1381B7|nr:cytochrome P450 [Nocardia spumae]
MTTTLPGASQLFASAHLDDPYPLYDRLRRDAPVYRVPGTDFHLVSSWELVAEAAGRTGDFSSHLTAVLLQHPGAAPTGFEMDGGGRVTHVLATADDPVHRGHRKLVSSVLAGRLRALGPTVGDLVDRLWSAHARDGRIDWAADMADRLPLALIATLIGLPGEDVPRLLGWAYDSTEMLGGVVAADRLPQLVNSAAALTGYLYERFQRAVRIAAPDGPPRDLLDALARACRRGQLSDEVAVLMLAQLVGAGGESTAGLIAAAGRILATHRDIQDLLRERPQLIPAFLDEVLRIESPFRGHYRHVVADTRLGAVELPAGSHLLLLWGAANRDPSIFSEPDTVDLHRPNGKSHLAFGRGVHFCVGSALARLEARTAITALLERSTDIGLDAEPRWVPSVFVRRHRTLPLRLR